MNIHKKGFILLATILTVNTASFPIIKKSYADDDIEIVSTSLNDNLSNTNINMMANYNQDDYYPRQKIAHLSYSQVKYLYEENIPRTRKIEEVIDSIIGLSPGPYSKAYGIIKTLGQSQLTSLDKAVEKAYHQKKGIDVYQQIHHSVQSLNRVDFVVAGK
ncbi:MAG: hypothetical protein E7H32_01105 [Anaerococcus sp.]|uniref:hypothetical protein n=1 Tax=Anaerococcus sp. TaxID=1872515 RepID=UPI002911416A|nr:hypothetical protein [Anaerococcus sp.]MDU4025265.1 hypothetical protein [Anaerococcus sp.]